MSQTSSCVIGRFCAIKAEEKRASARTVRMREMLANLGRVNRKHRENTAETRNTRNMGPARSRRLSKRGEPLGREQPVTPDDQLGNFVPVNLADIQAQRDPTAGSEVHRQVESCGIRGHQRGIVAADYFARHGNDAVAVMAIQEISELLLPDLETGVLT